MKPIALTITALLLPSMAPAAIIATEQFAYPAGSIAGQNGGSGFSTAWRGAVPGDPVGTVDGVGQSYPGLSTDGGGFVSNGDNKANFRNLTTTYGADGTTIFLSFLIAAQPGFGADNPYYAGFGLFDATDSAERLYLGKTFLSTNYGFVRIGGSGAGGADHISSALVSTASTFLVARIDFLAGDDTVSLFVNPTAGLGAPDVTATSSSVTDFNFDRIRIQTGFNTAPFKFDEIRIGTTFADVSPIPEPTSMIILGISGAALLARRTRQKISA